jgi:hypothetical protein
MDSTCVKTLARGIAVNAPLIGPSLPLLSTAQIFWFSAQ